MAGKAELVENRRGRQHSAGALAQNASSHAHRQQHPPHGRPRPRPRRARPAPAKSVTPRRTRSHPGRTRRAQPPAHLPARRCRHEYSRPAQPCTVTIAPMVMQHPRVRTSGFPGIPHPPPCAKAPGLDRPDATRRGLNHSPAAAGPELRHDVHEYAARRMTFAQCQVWIGLALTEKSSLRLTPRRRWDCRKAQLRGTSALLCPAAAAVHHEQVDLFAGRALRTVQYRLRGG